MDNLDNEQSDRNAASRTEAGVGRAQVDGEGDANFLRHVPCENPACGSSDANALYDDGHTYCFACGSHARGNGGDGRGAAADASPVDARLVRGHADAIPSRKLTKAVTQRFGYLTTAEDERGRACHAAPYTNAAGEVVGQKLRYPDKTFRIIGDVVGEALPFGAHLWPKTGKRLVVTEGEIDAMAASMVLGDWPVVSIGSGAGPQVRKYMAKRLDYFSGFETVVLCFDNDAPGQAAALDAAKVLGPRAHIATLPLKDAGEMLQAGRAKDLVNALWRAEPWRPDGVVRADSLLDEALKPTPKGWSYPVGPISVAMKGRRLNEITLLGAGSGIGKTEWCLLQIVESLRERPVATYLLEQSPVETALRIAGKLIGVKLHEGDASEADIRRGFAALAELHPLWCYDSKGVHDIDAVEQSIRYHTEYNGVEDHYLDNLTALAGGADDETEFLRTGMPRLARLTEELPIHLTLVSHLTAPERGLTHEEGGRVTMRHFRGSRAVAYWSHNIIGLERNMQADDDEERGRTTGRVLKCRKIGNAVGTTCDYWLSAGGDVSLQPPHGFNTTPAAESGNTDF